MLDEYWFDRKLTDNDLHIHRMKFHGHACETLELPLNSDTDSFCQCPPLRVFQQLDDQYNRLLSCKNQIFDSGIGSLF